MRRIDIDDGPGAVFHVSARVNWQKFLFAVPQRRDLVVHALRAACEAYGVEVLGYVVMSNHVHAVLRCPSRRLFATLTSRVTDGRHRRPWPRGHQNSSVLAQCMRAFMRTVSRIVHEQNEVTGRLWDRSYHARRLFDGDELCIALAYDHLNPVKARMVTRPEEYAWSSAPAWRLPGAPLWLAHGYREMPFDLAREELARRVVDRESHRPFLACLSRLEQEGLDWSRPGGLEELLTHLAEEARIRPNGPCDTDVAM